MLLLYWYSAGTGTVQYSTDTKNKKILIPANSNYRYGNGTVQYLVPVNIVFLQLPHFFRNKKTIVKNSPKFPCIKMSEVKTIAIFGSTGNTGKEILAAALEKGYKARVMVRNLSKLGESIKNNSNVTIFTGDFANTEAIKNTVKGADYVISAVGGALGKPEDFPTGAFVEFIKVLVKIMKATPTVKAFLHQSGAFVPHPDGSQPFMMNLMRKIAAHPKIGRIGPNLTENENIMKYIHSIQHDDDIKFNMIVTRPGGLKPGRSIDSVQLMASDTDIPMGMVTYSDLGRFTINAIEDEKLYGRYPYVVAKSSGSNITSIIVIFSAVLAGYMMYRK